MAANRESKSGRRHSLSHSNPMYTRGVLALLLIPLLLLLGLALMYPAFQAIRESLWGVEGGEFAEPYRIVLSDSVFWAVMRQTVQTAAVVAGLCFVMSYPTAEFINSVKTRWRLVLLALVVVPLWSSTIARTYAWVGIFIRNGVADSIASLFGREPLQLMYTDVAVYVGMTHVLLPFALLPIYGAVRAYPEELSLAAHSLGAGRLRTLLTVKLPYMGPQLIAPTGAVFILALGFFITPAILGGPGSQLVSNLIAQQILQRFDIPRAQAMAMVLLIAVLLVLAAAGLLLRAIRALTRGI